MRIDDINKMADADIIENEMNKLAENDEIQFIKKQLENIEHYKRGYNAAQTNLYTEKQVTQAMLEMCEYIIDAFERMCLIDANEKAKDIIKALKP